MNANAAKGLEMTQQPAKNRRLSLGLSDQRLLGYMSSGEEYLEVLVKLREYFGFKKKIRVLLFDNTEQMSQYMSTRVPKWVTGAYRNNDILMMSYDLWRERGVGSFCQVLLHEFVHIAVNERSANSCPLWLNEGLAMYFSGQHKTLRLERRLGDKEDIYLLSYADDYLYELSAKAIEALMELYGEGVIMKRISSSTDFERDELLGIENMKAIIKGLKL